MVRNKINSGLLSYLIFSFFNDKHLLAPKYSEYFTWSAPPLLHSWSDSLIGCSAPLYSRSGSLIGSAYYFLYISFCFRFNKSLTNLTSLCQHHLQYKTLMYLLKSIIVKDIYILILKVFLWIYFSVSKNCNTVLEVPSVIKYIVNHVDAMKSSL